MKLAEWLVETLKLLEQADDYEDQTLAMVQCHEISQRRANRLEILEDGMERIVNWAKAYPIEAFPEPDMAIAAKVLQEAGITLDAISASNIRHVIEEVGKIAKEALEAMEAA